MKKNIIVFILIVIGVTLIIFPFISDYITEHAQTKVVTEYQNEIGALTDNQKEEKFRNAEKYNNELEKDFHIDVSLEDDENNEEDENSKYLSQLDIGATMGYISIPKIGVELPIYHGTSDVVLKNGVGHFEASSLPVGGKNSHCVLAGHTGLASGKIFDNIDKLQLEDIFYLNVLDKTLEYKVDNIVKVDPNDTEQIKIVPEKDYVTLITCTPRLINSHRLLVRGERVQDTKKIIGNIENFEEKVPSSEKIITIEENNSFKTIIMSDKKIYIILGSVFILVGIFIGSHKFIKFEDNDKIKKNNTTNSQIEAETENKIIKLGKNQIKQDKIKPSSINIEHNKNISDENKIKKSGVKNSDLKKTTTIEEMSEKMKRAKIESDKIMALITNSRKNDTAKSNLDKIKKTRAIKEGSKITELDVERAKRAKIEAEKINSTKAKHNKKKSTRTKSNKTKEKE